LQTIKPIVGIISAGEGNSYGHPTQECLERLHTAGVKTYWTEVGNGASPEPGYDIVGGNIIVEADLSDSTFTVTHNDTQVDTYHFWGVGPSPESLSPNLGQPKYSWSKKSDVYHFATCKYVGNISSTNLERGHTP